jgi:hypothetical protein
MNKNLKRLKDQSIETHTYSDIDGDNNKGLRLNEEKFAELVIQECMKLNNMYVGSRVGEIDLNLIYKEHFGLK